MKPVKEFAVFFSGSLLALFIAAIAGHSQKPSDQMAQMRGMSVTTTDPSGNPCDVMASMAGMKVMGESMAAMTNHMCITPMRPKQPGDEGKAKTVVAQVRATIEKYKDYKKALADGYVQANPTVDQPQFHFNNDANAKLADSEFDPTRPTSLLYFQTPTQKFRLEGVMFTARPNATEDELNERIPLSVARWHKHTNFCGAPANKVKGIFRQKSEIRHVRFDPHQGSVRCRRRNLFARGLYLDDSRLPVRGRLQERLFHERRYSTLPLSQATAIS